MSLLKKSSLFILLSLPAIAGIAQIAPQRQLTTVKKLSADTIPLSKTPQQFSRVLLHTKLVKSALGKIDLKPQANAIYGADANLKSLRLTRFGNTFTEPSFTKNIGGINVHYKLKKNPDAETPATAANQGSSSASDGNFNCTTTRESVTAKSQTFMSVSANGAGIYPGAIYEYNDFYGGNYLKTVGDGKRNPITIYTNNAANSSGEVRVTVPSPTASTITDAIKPIVRNFSTTTGSATSMGQYTYSNTNAAMALNITAGGAYSGFSATAGFSIAKQDKHLYITCDYKIPLYLLSTEIPANGFFNDPSVESTPNLLLISSVMYGTRILANIDVDESSLSDSVFATFQYGDPTKAGAKAAFDYLQSQRSTNITINTYTVGNLPGVSPHPTSIDQLLAQIESVIKSTTYQTAAPIGYTLTDMAGNTIGVESATDTYTVKNCTPKDAVYRLVNAKVDLEAGDDGKDNGSTVKILLYSAGGHLAAMNTGNTEFPPQTTSTMALNIQTSEGPPSLPYFQRGNNYVEIYLTPKQVVFGWDAWNIKKVTLTLQFEDQNHHPYPQAQTIQMNNSQVRLEKDHQRVRCYFDARFQPTTTIQSN